jgi:hypothetical protein
MQYSYRYIDTLYRGRIYFLLVSTEAFLQSFPLDTYLEQASFCCYST